MCTDVCQGDGALAALPEDTDGKAPPDVRQAIDTPGANVTNGKPHQVQLSTHAHLSNETCEGQPDCNASTRVNTML